MNRIKVTVLAAAAMLVGIAISTPAATNVNANGVLWTYAYEGDYLPTDALSNPAWDLPLGISAGATQSVAGGILTAETTTPGTYVVYRQWGGAGLPWNPTTTGSTVETRLKVDTLAPGCSYSQSLTMRTHNRMYRIDFEPTFVRDAFTMDQFIMNTTDGFHIYRFTIQSDNGTCTLYVDNNPRPVMTTAGVADTADVLDFGVEYATDGGKVEWDYVRWSNEGAYAPPPRGTVMSFH